MLTSLFPFRLLIYLLQTFVMTEQRVFSPLPMQLRAYADRTRLILVEGQTDQRGVPVHLFPRRYTRVWGLFSGPEVIVDATEKQTICTLIGGELHDEQRSLATESAEHERVN